MALHLSARMHAFVHGLFRSTEDAQTAALYDEVSQLQAHFGVDTESGLDSLADVINERMGEYFRVSDDHPQAAVMRRLVKQLLDYETLFAIPPFNPNQKLTIAQHWEMRNALSAARAHLADFEEHCETLEAALRAMLAALYTACPSLLAAEVPDEGITVPTNLMHAIGSIGSVVEDLIRVTSDEDVATQKIMLRLRARLEYNVVQASGGNPNDPRGYTRAVKLPSQADQGQPEQLVSQYLGGTPLAALFDQTLNFTIPTETRFEHHHIVAGSGHGKTQTLQYLIVRDLQAVARGNRSVIVLDSQGDLIRNIASLDIFAPGEPLHDRIVIIDPSDVEWPVSLNLFDVGMERLEGYAPLERERLTNSILELYDYVLGSLLSAEMTQKQNVIFRYVTRLMLHIPDATIHTLRELMELGSEKKFAPYIATLTGTARAFFETEFASKEFEQTKKQVLRRLWGILENQTFDRMFSHPRSKLNLFAEMNAGKVILINTAKDLLKEQGTEIFGRFFIALIAQAAQERATLAPNKRTPTIVYVDEAQDYFDRNIGLILAQARKYNVGMVLAHQYLGQLDPKLLDAFAANTAIKFAGGVSAKDARALAPMLYCAPELIETQPKGSFVAHVRGRTKSAVPLQFPLGYLERQPRMKDADAHALRKVMREKYAVHYSTLAGVNQRDAEQVDILPPPVPPRHLDTDAGEAW